MDKLQKILSILQPDERCFVIEKGSDKIFVLLGFKAYEKLVNRQENSHKQWKRQPKYTSSDDNQFTVSDEVEETDILTRINKDVGAFKPQETVSKE